MAATLCAKHITSFVLNNNNNKKIRTQKLDTYFCFSDIESDFVEILLEIFKRRCFLKDMETFFFIQAVAWHPSLYLFAVFPLEEFIRKRTQAINRKERFLNWKLEHFMTFVILLIINTNDVVPVPFAFTYSSSLKNNKFEKLSF
jgi:hypothetical protein